MSNKRALFLYSDKSMCGKGVDSILKKFEVYPNFQNNYPETSIVYDQEIYIPIPEGAISVSCQQFNEELTLSQKYDIILYQKGIQNKSLLEKLQNYILPLGEIGELS